MQSYNYLYFFNLIILIWLCPSSSFPTHYPSGLINEDSFYKSLPQQAAFDGAKLEETPLTVDLSAYCPKVGNQGNIHSCVGWAVGYGAMTIERAILNDWQDKEQITASANSALFVYNQIKAKDCNGGARLSDAMQFITQKGDCLAKDFDTDINNCEKQPEDILQTDALEYAVADFMTLFSSDASAAFKTMKIKKTLAQKKPVIVGFQINSDFYKLKNAKYWWTDNNQASPAGGHAAVIVGYDDRKAAFLVFNSWGKAWGNRGYIWVKYQHFSPLCRYAYILQLKPSAPNKAIPEKMTTAVQAPFSHNDQDLAGQIIFKTLKKGDFRPVPVQFTGDYYTTTPATWNLGQMFQLSVQTQERAEYLYVLSRDAQHKIQLHFPKNSTATPVAESPLIIHPNSELFIPNPHSALMLTESGSEYLCMLFSKEKIKDIHQICEQLDGRDEEVFPTLLAEIIGDRYYNKKQVNYHPKKIAFEAQVESSSIVPLVLKITGVE